MAATTAAVATTAYGAYSSSKASKDAANAQSDSAAAAAAAQERMYQQTREDLTPYRDAGIAPLNRLAAVGQGDFSSFYKSPDYQFAFDEGQRALDSSGASRGMTLSGAQLKAAQKYGQGLATQNYQNWFRNNYDLASLGQNSATQTGSLGASSAASQGNALMAGGNARASGYLGSANAINSGLAGFNKIIGDKWG